MKSIPVTTADVLKMLNLPADMSTNDIFELHSPLVLKMLSEYTTEDAYAEALDDEEAEPGEDEAVVYTTLQTAFRFGYAFLMLNSTCEFLNLKTVGQGIVKTIGLDSSATALLTGGEIDAFKDSLETRALTLLKAYLSPVGIARMDALNPKPRKLVRAVVI